MAESMLEERIIYHNGDFIPWHRATVHMMSHSFARGSGIFEVMSLHATPYGPAVFRLDDHVIRLSRTAELLDMELPLSNTGIKEAVLETIRKNDVKQGLVKIMGFFSGVSLGIVPPEGPLDLSIFALDTEKDLGGLPFHGRKGVNVCVSSWRKLHPETVPIEAKVAANYLNGMLAAAEARRRGFDSAIMLDSEGCIAEGGTDSVFLAKEGRLMTPALGTVLKGITRASVMDAADALGIRATEERLPARLLYEADEIFLSGTPVKVLPVTGIEDRHMGVVPGPVTRRLAEFVTKIVEGREERFKDRLFFVE